MALSEIGLFRQVALDVMGILQRGAGPIKAESRNPPDAQLVDPFIRHSLLE
jgi:hypothetical protein